MTTTPENEILTQEALLTRATREIDLDALDRLYADDILFTGVTGRRCDKASLMDEARRGLAQRRGSNDTPPVPVSYDKDDIQVVVHGGAGITSFRFAVSMHHDGKDISRMFRSTNVWMKRPGGWQVVAAHTTKIDASSGQ